MEKYFKPVHCPSDLDKRKKHSYDQQDPRANRYFACGYTNNTDETPGHCSQRSQHFQNNICPDEEDFDYDQSSAPVTLSRASSSSLTSSTSSSSTSWYREASVNDNFIRRHAERPQHSLSCSNIHDARRLYQVDDATDPIVFATVKHGSNGSVYSEVHRASSKGKQVLSPLDRGHSRSDDGFVQKSDREIVKSHLNRSLGFSEEDIMLGVSKGPKRTVSSGQLPSKGILKNKDTLSDIRKAKSMEVLSSAVSKEQSLVGQKTKGLAKVDIEKAREHFVQEKIKFSAFLDEITKQVISPCDLKTLGLNTNKISSFASNEPQNPPRPQLPPKKHKEISVEGNEQKCQNKHIKTAPNSSRKHCDPGKFDKSYAGTNHCRSPPLHYSNHNKTRKDRRPPSSETVGYARSGLHLTDGTSTSPELIQPRQRYTPQPAPRSLLSHEHHRAHCLPSSCPTAAGLGSESSSSKSDSSRTRETVSTATSSELSGCYLSQHVTHSEARQGMQCEGDHLQALQEENADLHQNLLQTVVCIENLEAELQHTRDELINVKEKYKSLLESHSGPQQVNHLPQDHSHAETETLSNERQYMFTRVAHLSSELEAAHKTIAALENINMPNLIKELLEKHLFHSAENKQQFVSPPTVFSRFNSSPKTEATVEGLSQHDWLSKSEIGPQRPTAFSPVTHGLLNTENQTCFSGSLSSCSSHFGAPDIKTAYYGKVTAGLAPAIQPVCVKPLLITTAADTLQPSVQQTCVGGDNCAGQDRVKVVQAEQPVVTALSAQQILNEFMQQLQAQKESDRDSTAHKASETLHN